MQQTFLNHLIVNQNRDAKGLKKSRLNGTKAEGELHTDGELLAGFFIID